MKRNSPNWLLGGGIFAAIGASVCCIGPLLLFVLGVTGSWISTLTAFDAVRPYFIGVFAILYLYIGWQLYRPISQCKEGSVCAIPETRRYYRLIFWGLLVISIILILSPYWVLWFF